MNIEEIRARCEEIIESGLLDRERYENMKEYMSLLESHLDAYWDMYQSASRECDRLTSELQEAQKQRDKYKHWYEVALEAANDLGDEYEH